MRVCFLMIAIAVALYACGRPSVEARDAVEPAPDPHGVQSYSVGDTHVYEFRDNHNRQCTALSDSTGVALSCTP